MARKSISVNYSRVTPESAEEGEPSETGHLETVPITLDEYDREEGLTEADLVVKVLKNEGAMYPSSTAFHRGVWYTTESQVIDYGTGEEEERSFHLKGFSQVEERDVFNTIITDRLTRKRE